MQFIPKGPDIPDSLLQAHEEGRVIFFCGAGISYPAGLPDFKGLVDKIYALTHAEKKPEEEKAYGKEQYDATLDLLERNLAGQRLAVRTALQTVLQPKLRCKGAIDTHKALLELSYHNSVLRLVTTNFDRIFEAAAKRSKRPINVYSAPMLPIPKHSKWDGLVHLHGLLPDNTDESALNRLVLTSGDFGLAYLTERWASRFVSELFRNYVVCFVGYSINDPVLRYMMDALAADRMLGESTLDAYAFGDSHPGEEGSKTAEWKAKGVTPILYEVPAGARDHSALHRTLKVWAETYRDGILGKERIVVDNAMAKPSGNTRQDDFVGRMLWALSHKSGLPAKRFAEFNPVPSLEWLDPFAKDIFHHADLIRFGVPLSPDDDDKLKFSLLCRPAPYHRAPWMAVTSEGMRDTNWDEVMTWIAKWLVRHLNDPTLILWCAQQGGHLHETICYFISTSLEDYTNLEREGKTEELAKIRSDAPNAIPELLMRTLWNLMISGRIKTRTNHDLCLYTWIERFKRDGLNFATRLELRDLLKPQLTLNKPILWCTSNDGATEGGNLRQLIGWELVLASDDAEHFFHEMTASESELWQNALPALLADFQNLLVDALDLLRDLGDADDHSDRSYWDLPSISPHTQNRGSHDWVTLIELIRDAWLSMRRTAPEKSSQIAKEWYLKPYPTFKRLALFAASQDGCIPSKQWVEWLLDNNSWCLWALETRRETLRLLVQQGRNLSLDAQKILEVAILAGPSQLTAKRDITLEDWHSIADRLTWLALAKLQHGQCKLTNEGLSRLNDISAKHPEWQITSDDHDEFPFWITTSGDAGYKRICNTHNDPAPRTRKELVSWLSKYPKAEHHTADDQWTLTCRERFYHCFTALCDLSNDNQWPTDRWNTALQVWSEERQVLRSWRLAAPLVINMPLKVLQETAHAVAWWLAKAAKSIDRNNDIFMDLCHRLLEIEYSDNYGNFDSTVTSSINHPVGLVTEALLDLWFKRDLSDNERLPDYLKPVFSRLCNTENAKFRYGRVILASRLIALFRVDRQWTEDNLLKLFDWEQYPAEAKAVWEGFLWSPRIYQPLLFAVKRAFLDTASHYADLGEHARQYASFLTYVALDRLDGFSPPDFRKVIASLPAEGLHEVAHSLIQALKGAGDQHREDYWKNRIEPFWQEVWPKSIELSEDPVIAKAIARLILETRNEFPSALLTVKYWLSPIHDPNLIIRSLKDSGLSKRYPTEVLSFLDAIIAKEPPGMLRYLRQCLVDIIETQPALKQTASYQRLEQLSR